MINIQDTKLGLLVPPQLKGASGSPASLTYIDTVGYDHLRVLVLVGATDTEMSAAPKLTECDTYNGQYADITDAALAAAIAADDDNKLFVIDVNLKGRKRLIKPAITCASPAGSDTGVNLAVVAILSEPTERSPESAAAAGLEEHVKV